MDTQGSCPSSLSPAAKRRRSTSSSSTKVCIICFHSPSYDYFVYTPEIDIPDAAAEDVSDDGTTIDGLIPLHPFLRLKGFGASGFCVLNSALFMFSGYEERGYKLELENINLSGLTLEKSVMDKYAYKLPSMGHSKCQPIAVATLDAKKILVFSSMPQDMNPNPNPNPNYGYFSNKGFVDPDLSYDFELFDSETLTWKTLAGLPAGCRLGESVYAYGFLTNSIFLVSVRGEDDMFYLDIEKPCDSWKRYHCIPMLSRHTGPFWTIDEGLFITDHMIERFVQDDGSRSDSSSTLMSSCVAAAISLPSFGAAVAEFVYEPTETQSMGLLSHVREVGCIFLSLSVASLTTVGDRYPLAINVGKFDIMRYRAAREQPLIPNDDSPDCLSPSILKKLSYALIAQTNGTLHNVTVARLGE